jgi:hypothetical protein
VIEPCMTHDSSIRPLSNLASCVCNVLVLLLLVFSAGINSAGCKKSQVVVTTTWPPWAHMAWRHGRAHTYSWVFSWIPKPFARKIHVIFSHLAQ